MLDCKQTSNFNLLKLLVSERRQSLRSFIYDKVKDLYYPLGAPSIDPVVFIKIVLIQYLFDIHSMGQTIREIEVNVEYRCF